MALEIDLLPPALNGPAEGGVHRAAGAEVKEVDAVVDGLADDGLDLFRGRVLDAAHAQTQHADALSAVGKLPVFHRVFLLCVFLYYRTEFIEMQEN